MLYNIVSFTFTLLGTLLLGIQILVDGFSTLVGGRVYLDSVPDNRRGGLDLSAEPTAALDVDDHACKRDREDSLSPSAGRKPDGWTGPQREPLRPGAQERFVPSSGLTTTSRLRHLDRCGTISEALIAVLTWRAASTGFASQVANADN